MGNTARWSKRAVRLGGLVSGALIVAYYFFPYDIVQLLACWLFFGLAFGVLALLALVIVIVYCAVEGIVHWSTAAAHKVSRIELGDSELHLKKLPTYGKPI